MTKYNVCKIMVRTKTGKDPFATLWDNLNNMIDHHPDEIVSFDTEKEAKAYYDAIDTYVMRRANGEYEHYCKYIVPAEYDEDGRDITDGGDYLYEDFPDYKEDYTDDEDDKEDED